MFELESSSIISGSSGLVVHLHNLSLLIINLLIKATIKPVPIGSNNVGITKDAEKPIVVWGPWLPVSHRSKVVLETFVCPI